MGTKNSSNKRNQESDNQMALQLQQNLIQILGQDEDKFGSDQAEMAAKSYFFRKEHLRMVA